MDIMSSSPPRTDANLGNNNNNNLDMELDIDSPINDIDIDSPIDNNSNLDSNISMRSSRSGLRGSPSSIPSSQRGGLRPNRPQTEVNVGDISIHDGGRNSNVSKRNNALNSNHNVLSDAMNVLSSESSGVGTGGVAVTIWGTNVNIDDIHRRFRRFIAEFALRDEAGTVIYPLLIQQAIEAETWNLNLDCHNVHAFDRTLYESLTNFPQEVLPAFDEVVNTYAQKEFAEDMQELSVEHDIWVRPFNLLSKDVRSMRNMDPQHIDQLVAICGMVIRSTSVIPDIQTAFFRCILCNHEVEVAIDMGRIPEPTKCANERCQGSHTMELIHNRCKFQDKQLVKIQETPENIPDGETPQTIDVYCYDHMVDYCRPGDRVTVTGVFRVSSIRTNSRRRQVESVFRTYIDSVHIRKAKSTSFAMSAENSDGAKNDNENDGDTDVADSAAASFEETDEANVLREHRVAKIQELAKDPKIYARLTKSLAPSIWEMDDVKKGILCQLFGACSQLKRQQAATTNQKKTRDQINILLCGDPGTSKSQLLTYVHKIAPRGIYTSGKGSSAVGLTAYISKDPESGDLVLESGALVLSDRGICQIDEFDKMSESARSILHEVMEQQTVSIAKAGIICTLNARTSILAAANPIESRYNPTKSVVENIDLPPTLMSRFDLIYLILDRPNEHLDRKLAKHIVSLYHGNAEEEAAAMREQNTNGDGHLNASVMDFGTDDDDDDGIEAIDQKLLMEYISYSRREIQPQLSDDACEKLINGYVDMRSLGRMRGKKVITATPRQLESLIRISEALAKMRHSQVVTGDDVEEAMRLHKVATLAAATDPKTGAIDLDSINVGRTMEEGQALMKQCAVVLEVLRTNAKRLTSIRLSKLVAKYNVFMGGDENTSKHLTLLDMKKVVNRLKEADKLRPGDWLNDDPVIKILDTDEM